MYRSDEQAAYAAAISAAVNPEQPLLLGAAAGLGKTHGYTIPLVTSGRQVAVALPTRQLIDQYLNSDALAQALSLAPSTSVAALRSRRDFDNRTDYINHRTLALSAQLMVVTHAAALIDSMNGDYACLRDRDVVLFDEADLLPDAADLRSAFSVSAEVLSECGASSRDHKKAAEKVRDNASEAEDRAAARAILYALDNPAWYKAVGLDGETGDLVLRHRLPGRMLMPLVRDCRRAIFTSGTMQVSGRFDYFSRVMGIRSYDPASRHVDPVQHGTLTVEITNKELTDAEKAARILAAPRPTLVLTPSHELTATLGELLPGAVVRQPAETLIDAVNRCSLDSILVAAGAWSGLDTPALRWKSVVIPKVPYGAPVEVEGQQLTHYLDSRTTAVRRINQGLHRGLREPDAACELLILDLRANRADLREAIPARFRLPVLFEGDRREVELDAVERNPNVRTAALKHYGVVCMACGFSPRKGFERQVEVHHLIPVSTGARRTRIETDVVVVCRNCHAAAHSQDPPLPLDDLKQLV
jgi:Rad3-related DNA helicase